MGNKWSPLATIIGAVVFALIATIISGAIFR